MLRLSVERIRHGVVQQAPAMQDGAKAIKQESACGELVGVIVSFQQIDTVAADQAVASPMRRLGM